MAPDRKAKAPIDTLLRSYPEDVQVLVHQARETLREWLPNVDEGVDASARMVAYRYGPGYKGMVCTLILSKSGVKLGLVKGAALADPHGLLAGSGKVHRHVQLRTVRDLEQAGLKQRNAPARVKRAGDGWDTTCVTEKGDRASV